MCIKDCALFLPYSFSLSNPSFRFECSCTESGERWWRWWSGLEIMQVPVTVRLSLERTFIGSRSALHKSDHL